MVVPPNEGFKAGIGQKSDAYRYALSLKGAPRRTVEQRLNSLQGITAGRDSTEQLFDVFSKKGGKPEDFAIAVPFCKPGNLGKLAGEVVVLNPRDPFAESKDLIAARKHLGHIPVGFVVVWLDRRKKPKFVAHARPLLLDHASLTLLEDLVAKAADLKDWRLQ